MADFFQNVCAAAKIRPNDPDEDLDFAVKADLSTRRSPAVSASAQPTFAGTRCLPIEDYFHRIPLVPWICPPLHPELLRLLENIGQESVLAPGAQIYREGEPVSRFAVVKKGLVARKLGTYGAKSDNQIGLAGPGNIATGNLNIFSHRPAVGAYEAILPTSIVWCEHREFFEIARRNPDLFMLLATQCELSMLSDRLAFACLTLLNSEQAMKVVLLSWTSHFGHLEGDEVIAPRVLTRSIIRSVLGCSMGWVDRLAAEWRRNDVRRVEGGIVHYRLDILQEANEILCDLEEKVSGLPRPRDVRRYWQRS